MERTGGICGAALPSGPQGLMASHSRFAPSVLYAVNRLPNYYANTGFPSRKDGLPLSNPQSLPDQLFAEPRLDAKARMSLLAGLPSTVGDD